MGNLFGKRRVTILSIDGGGIRGLLPATILSKLEDELQVLENRNDIKLAEYFDVMAGTSAGALITAMLAAPSPRNAEEITNLLCEKGPTIFSNPPKEEQTAPKEWTYQECWNFAKAVLEKIAIKPVYDGKELADIADTMLGKDTLLKDTLTNVVIPAYDVTKLCPVIFTSRYDKENNRNKKLTDVVVSSASAPYYFPPKEFDADGKHYKLIDGGIVANNPTLLAIKEAIKIFGSPAADYSNYVVLSLGTGKENLVGGHNVGNGGIWDLFVNFDLEKFKIKTPPIVDMLFKASDDVAEIAGSLILGQHHHHHNNFRRNYLRIQDYEMEEEDAEMDNTSKMNIDKLKIVGQLLLSKRVAIPDSETGLPHHHPDHDDEISNKLHPSKRPPTYQDELRRFAKILCEERRRRLRYKKYLGLVNPPLEALKSFAKNLCNERRRGMLYLGLIKPSLGAIMAVICFLVLVGFGYRRVEFF